jgi:hypothetical protein
MSAITRKNLEELFTEYEEAEREVRKWIDSDSRLLYNRCKEYRKDRENDRRAFEALCDEIMPSLKTALDPQEVRDLLIDKYRTAKKLILYIILGEREEI